jgi:hypothetical protein
LILLHAFEQDSFGALRAGRLSPAASTVPAPMPAKQSASMKPQRTRLTLLPDFVVFIACLQVKVVMHGF